MASTCGLLILTICVLACCVKQTFGVSLSPMHVHLSVSHSTREMNVVWVTAGQTNAVVEYWSDTQTKTLREGTSTHLTYGEGYVHQATMNNLSPSQVYYYRVGSFHAVNGEKNFIWSKEMHFHTRFDIKSAYESDAVHFAAYGDQGVSVQAYDIVSSVAHPEFRNTLDLMLHVGDLAYAFGNFSKWHTYFERAENIAGYVPYMICTGNRDEEELIRERFWMPYGSEVDLNTNKEVEMQNFYYSFDYNWVHIVSISIKHPTDPTSPQYEWLEEVPNENLYKLKANQDLKNANERRKSSRAIRWIVLLGHTPLYSSSNGHTGGNKELKANIESLLFKYHVDFAIWGDDHGFERSFPVYDDTPDPTTMNGIFVDPQYPIHFVVGTGGIALDGWQEGPAPSWSANRVLQHGILKMSFTHGTATFSFVGPQNKHYEEFDSVVVVKKSSGISFGSLLWLLVIGGVVVYVVFRRRHRLRQWLEKG